MNSSNAVSVMVTAVWEKNQTILYLYYYGDEKISVTGGWNANGARHTYTVVAAVKNADNFYFKPTSNNTIRILKTANSIDLTLYNNLCMEYEVETFGNHWYAGQIGAATDSSTTNRIVALTVTKAAYTSYVGFKHNYCADISEKSGYGYVYSALYADSNQFSSGKAYAIWLEK